MNGLDEVFTFGGINWLAVVVAAVAAFVVGGIWYNGKGAIGKKWQEEQAFSKKQLTQLESGKAMAGLVGLTFVLNLAQSVLLALIIDALVITEFVEGLLFGALIGMVWAAGSLAVNNAYGLKTLRLFAIDGGYMVLYFAVMGAILASW